MPSAETRYGAFRALWAMNARDPLVQGETLGGFNYHVMSTDGPAMIHVTRSFRPEIVIFGHEQSLKTPLAIEAGNNILINASEGEEITISRFVIGQADQKRVVSNKVDDVIRAIVELGGTYPDVVLALQQAKRLTPIERPVCWKSTPFRPAAANTTARTSTGNPMGKKRIRPAISKWPIRFPSCFHPSGSNTVAARNSPGRRRPWQRGVVSRA